MLHHALVLVITVSSYQVVNHWSWCLCYFSKVYSMSKCHQLICRLIKYFNICHLTSATLSTQSHGLKTGWTLPCCTVVASSIKTALRFNTAVTCRQVPCQMNETILLVLLQQTTYLRWRVRWKTSDIIEFEENQGNFEHFVKLDKLAALFEFLKILWNLRCGLICKYVCSSCKMLVSDLRCIAHAAFAAIMPCYHKGPNKSS